MLPYLDSNKKIPSYGVMMFLGIGICFLLVLFLDTKSKIKREDRIYASSFALIGGILGAKLLAVLISIEYIIEYNISIVDIIKNGFVFYGGFIGGALGLIIYARIYKLNIIDFFDFAAVILPMGQVFGRFGCFLAGCCYGHPTDSFLGVTYHTSADITTPLGVPILPTQIFESIYCLLIFTAQILLCRKPKKRGVLTAVYAISYGVCRFINEFFRYDSTRGFLWGFSTSQIISIFIILLTVGILIFSFIKNKQKRKTKEYLTD